MTRTRPLTLIVAAILGGVGAWLLEVALLNGGSPLLIPPVTLPVALIVIGVLVVAAAVPVRRAVRDRQKHRIDPFYATRVVVLAKASSLAASLLAGMALGVTIFLLGRPLVAGVGSVLLAVITAVGAIILLVAGLIAEHMCSIPPGEDDDGEESRATVQPR